MFADTPNKKIIRTRWNIPILRFGSSRLGRRLSYFGMPGAELCDLLDWSELLGTKTCVQIIRTPKSQEEEDRETIRQMMHNVMVNEIKEVQIMRGAVEDILIKGLDRDRTAPKLSELEDGNLHFQYDLYNLDFLGGVAYKRKVTDGARGAKSVRVKAIEDLFVRQRGHSFTLFLTINVRDTLGEEPLQYLEDIRSRSLNSVYAETLAWCSNLEAGKKFHQLKLWIPLWIRELAEMAQFDCRCYPTVTYEGHERARMIHFAFDFTFLAGRDLRVNSGQSFETVVTLPLLTAVDGDFRFVTLAGSPCVECRYADANMTAEALHVCLNLNAPAPVLA